MGCLEPVQEVFLYSKFSRPAVQLVQSLNLWVSSLTPEVNWPWLETDTSLPSSAKVKNGGAIPLLPYISRSQSSVVVIVSKAMAWKVQGSNPGRGKKFFSSPNIETDCLWSQPGLLFTDYWCPIPGIKRPRRDVTHFHLVARLRMSRVVCVHGFDRENIARMSRHGLLWDSFSFAFILYQSRSW